jgi:hypothetical protein
MRPDVPVAPIRASKDEHADVAIEEPFPDPESVLDEAVAMPEPIAMAIAIEASVATPVKLPV